MLLLLFLVINLNSSQGFVILYRLVIQIRLLIYIYLWVKKQTHIKLILTHKAVSNQRYMNAYTNSKAICFKWLINISTTVLFSIINNSFLFVFRFDRWFKMHWTIHLNREIDFYTIKLKKKPSNHESVYENE